MWFAAPALAFETVADDPAFLGVILLSRGDEVVFERARGTDRGGRPIGRDTPFHVASIGKVAAAAALLDVLGDRSLDEPVAAFLPEWPPDALSRDGVPCTLRLLAAHRCGLPRDLPHDGDVHRDRAAERRFLAAVLDAGLDFTPGTSARYSNVGYTLIGAIAARLGGAPYCALLSRGVLAGASATGCTVAPDLADRIAPGHFELPWGPARSERWLGIPWDGPIGWGAARNLHATAPELGAWFRALVRGAILDAQATNELLTPVHGDRALGVRVSSHAGERLVWASGTLTVLGSTAFVGHVPATDTTVVVLANRGVDAFALGLALVGGDPPRTRGWLAGAPGLVYLVAPNVALAIALATPFRSRPRDVLTPALQIVCALAVFALIHALLDRHRPPSSPGIALALATVALAALLARHREVPAVARRAGLAGAACVLALVLVLAGQLDALPQVAALAALGAAAVGTRAILGR